MKSIQKQCSCDKYECTIDKSKTTTGKFSIWVIVSSLGRIVVAITTMFWGGKDCEAKKEANSINS